MARFDDEFLGRMKDETDIVALIESYGTKLKPRGEASGEMIGLCPIHDDKNPSLVVNRKKNVWNCLGACGCGGDVIQWVMHAEKVSFRHAVELARNGVLGQVESFEVGLPPGYDKPQGSTEVQSPPEHLDYDFWCGPAPKLPYMRARHHRWWRGHSAFGGGVLMDWIGHHNDIAHWAINVERSGPTLVEAVDWKFPDSDVYDTPREYTIRCEYPCGIASSVSSHTRPGLKLIGSDGWVHVDRGKIAASDDRWLQSGFRPGSEAVYESNDHTGNFLECVRSRRECIAPADVAHRSITPGHLAYVSHRLQQPLKWNADAQRVENSDEANRLLSSVSYREPWQLSATG